MFLDQNVGKGEWLLVMSADHGVGPTSRGERGAPGIPADAFTNEPLVKAVQQALLTKYGEGKWIEATSHSGLSTSR